MRSWTSQLVTIALSRLFSLCETLIASITSILAMLLPRNVYDKLAYKSTYIVNIMTTSCQSLERFWSVILLQINSYAILN